MSPLLTDDEKVLMNKPFAHTCDPDTGFTIPEKTIYWGGYGYNYQYLGNARTPGGIPPFHAKDTMLKGSQTIAIADTQGSKNGSPYWTSEGVYVVDPPLMSMNLGSRGSRRSSAEPGGGQYGYSGGNDGDPSHRATPAQRNRGKVNAVFCDGHAEAMTLKQLDDFNRDGQPDNGWWNGKADATQR
jgi:prepilin-type processing-associated H-X9-DG protein